MDLFPKSRVAQPSNKLALHPLQVCSLGGLAFLRGVINVHVLIALITKPVDYVPEGISGLTGFLV